jgi:hypothetical protein
MHWQTGLNTRLEEIVHMHDIAIKTVLNGKQALEILQEELLPCGIREDFCLVLIEKGQPSNVYEPGMFIDKNGDLISEGIVANLEKPSDGLLLLVASKDHLQQENVTVL